MKRRFFSLLLLIFPLVMTSCGAVDFSNNNAGKQITSLLGLDGTDGSGTDTEPDPNTTPTAPTAPGGLQASMASIQPPQIQLDWNDASDNENGYRIERKTSSQTSFSVIADLLPSGTTTYADNGVALNTTYFYRVVAFNDSGDSAYSNVANTTINAATPAAPTNLAANATSSTQITISWSDNSNNESGFLVERRAASETAFTEIAWNVAANSTSYVSNGLSAETTYYYRVRATNANGNSAYSNTASATTQAINTEPGTLLINEEFNFSWITTQEELSESPDGLWRRSNWEGTYGNLFTFGNAVILPSYANATGGALQLSVDANVMRGGEIQSVGDLGGSCGYGYYEVRMKLTNVSGTCTSFFWIAWDQSTDAYGPPEIDIEFLTNEVDEWNNTTGTVWFSVNGQQDWQCTKFYLPFNPSTAFHRYGFLWTPDGLTYTVDGVAMFTYDAQYLPIPSTGSIMANAWTGAPDWGGGPPTTEATTTYDWIKFYPNETSIPHD